MGDRMTKLSVAQALLVLDAARKHDELIASYQLRGYSEKDRAALFAASQEAAARKRKTDWRLPEGPL